MFKKTIVSISLLVTLFVASLLPYLAFAQATSPTPSVSATPVPAINPAVQAIDNSVPTQDANSLIAQFFSLLAAGKVTAAVGVLVVLLTFLFRKYFVDTNKVGSGALPWLSVALGAIFGIGSNLILGASPLAAAEAILFAGPMASTLWSGLLKLVVKKVV
jgi:hypothetical protein